MDLPCQLKLLSGGDKEARSADNHPVPLLSLANTSGFTWQVGAGSPGVSYLTSPGGGGATPVMTRKTIQGALFPSQRSLTTADGVSDGETGSAAHLECAHEWEM